jgi:hypothetical protein
MLLQVGDLAGVGRVVRETKEFVLALLEFRASGAEREAKAEGMRLKNREQDLRNEALRLQNEVEELKVQDLKFKFRMKLRVLRKNAKRQKKFSQPRRK